MVLFPHERIAGPNEVKDRVVVLHPDRARRTLSEVDGPCLTDAGAAPTVAIIEGLAPAVKPSDEGPDVPPGEPPSGGPTRVDPAAENR